MIQGWASYQELELRSSSDSSVRRNSRESPALVLFILEEEEVALLFTFEVHEVLVFILEVEEEEEELFIVFGDSAGFVSTLQREQKSSQNGSVPSTLVGHLDPNWSAASNINRTT